MAKRYKKGAVKIEDGWEVNGVYMTDNEYEQYKVLAPELATIVAEFIIREIGDDEALDMTKLMGVNTLYTAIRKKTTSNILDKTVVGDVDRANAEAKLDANKLNAIKIATEQVHKSIAEKTKRQQMRDYSQQVLTNMVLKQKQARFIDLQSKKLEADQDETNVYDHKLEYDIVDSSYNPDDDVPRETFDSDSQ